MLQINWKLRIQNVTTLISLIACLVSLIYTILGLFGIVPPVSQELWVQLFSLILEILLALGIIVDPTTKGITDSNQALTYNTPKEDDKNVSN